MDNKDKVYYPEVINETPFPSQTPGASSSVTQPSSNGVYQPQRIAEQTFPTKKIAVELISTALNTQSKKILQEFEFTPSGALQIGKQENGISGDVRISPNGIVARDTAGNTTFSLDGESGDATFAGRIQSGSLVTGQVAVGDGSIQIDGDNDRIILYADDGLPAIVIGEV